MKKPKRYFSPAHRAKLSKASKGHPVSEETREKIRHGNKGRKLTPAQRKKLSKARLGMKFSDSHKVALAISRGGRPFKCVETGKVYFTLDAAAADHKLWKPNVWKCLKGKLQTTGGFHFCYLESP